MPDADERAYWRVERMGVLIPGISLALSYLRQLAAAKSWGATKRQAKNSRYQKSSIFDSHI